MAASPPPPGDGADDDVMTSAPATPAASAAAPIATRPPPTDLHAWRATLARARGGRALLDALIEPHDAARLIPKLPIDDLHAYVHRIGLADADAVLALASDAQVRGMLDTDIWTRDTLALDRVDPWLTALMRAGPKVLTTRLLALDDGLLSWLIRRTVETIVIDDPNDFEAPDGEYVVTPDGALCIRFPHGEPRDLPIKVFLDRLMRDDAELCINLLVHSQVALDSNLEEDAYRWRSGRMADRGYVDYYDALAIYTAPRPDQIRDAQSAIPADAPAVERWLVPVLAPAARLADAFGALDPEAIDAVQGALGYIANMALSADRVEPWDDAAQAATLDRLRAGLVLGLDALAGPDADPARDAEVLAQTTLALVFRTGYARTLEAAAPLRRALKDDLLTGLGGRVDGVDLPALRPWAESLADRHPHGPAGPFTTTEQLTHARHRAALIAELGRVAGRERPRAIGVGAWLITWMTRDLIGLDGPGALPADRLPDAHRALFARGRLTPAAHEAAADWWRRAGGDDPFALEQLVDAATEALAGIAPADLDPRYLPLWYVGEPATP
ncbi:MAG: hypothetical protein H6701_02245 [Myxococcales bacterium]|nr:hypothetical protein [Myxococcales bacterium]